MRSLCSQFIWAACFIFLSFAGSAWAQQSPEAPSVPVIQPEELAEMQFDSDVVILDTRSPQEYQEGHLENARFVNFETFSLQEVADLSKDQKIVVYCKAGGRSNQVAQQLIDAGYKRVKNLEGGLSNWKEHGYETVND